MAAEANGTAEPPCGLREPPYARQLLRSLDLAGVFLFAILTLMTLIAILVFVEEVVYIYRKIPPSKRSILIWINAAAPVIATTSCIGMWIPRSTMFTDFTAAVFFAIVIHKFLLMMIKECGGQKLFLRRFENGRFKISTGPCCCCCLCLPRVRITRLLHKIRSLKASELSQGSSAGTEYWGVAHIKSKKLEDRMDKPFGKNGPLEGIWTEWLDFCRPCHRRTLLWLKLGTFQFVFFRPVLMFLSIVLWTNGNYKPYNLSLDGAAIWINCFIGILTIIALWPVGIMFQQVRTILSCKKIIPKFALYQFILILSQLQAAIINILAMQRIIPCVPPLSSSARGSYMIQQLLIVEMFLITLISRVVYRRRYDELEPPEGTPEEGDDNKQTLKIIPNGALSQDGLPGV